MVRSLWPLKEFKYRYVSSFLHSEDNPPKLEGWEFCRFVVIAPKVKRASDMAMGHIQQEKDLAIVLNATQDGWVIDYPNAFGIGALAPEIFGNVCIRWLNTVTEPLNQVGLKIPRNDVELDFPIMGGPQHYAMLIKLSGGVVGIDQGYLATFFGKGTDIENHMFCPSDFQNVPTYSETGRYKRPEAGKLPERSKSDLLQKWKDINGRTPPVNPPPPPVPPPPLDSAHPHFPRFIP